MVCAPIGRCGIAANITGRSDKQQTDYDGSIHRGMADSLVDCFDRAGWFWVGIAVAAGIAVFKK